MDASMKFLLIKELEIFSTLNHNQISELSTRCTIQSIKKDEVIYRNGDEIANVYVVQKGSIKLGSNIDSSRSIIKQLAHDGELFGENILGKENQRKDFAQALSDSQVITIPKLTFEDLLLKNSEFSASIVSQVLNRLAELEQRISDFVYKKAQKRIEGFLKKLAFKKGIKIGFDEILVKHSLSHSDIAFLTDTSRQTVSRVLGELKRADIIHFSTRKPNKILIRNIGKLA